MSQTVMLVVFALAVARVTRLVTTDDITANIRSKIIALLDDRERTLGEHLARLIVCDWCVSVYVGLAVAPLVIWHYANPAVTWPVLALALSQVVGMLASREGV